MVGRAGNGMCTVDADITLTKVKVKIAVLLNSENCRKLNFSRSISSAILAWSSKLMVDYDNMGLSLQLIGARFLNFRLRKLSLNFKLCGMSILQDFQRVLWAGVQPTLDPYAEAFFIRGPFRYFKGSYFRIA